MIGYDDKSLNETIAMDDKILELLLKRAYYMAELATELNTNWETVAAQLIKLEKKGYIESWYGEGKRGVRRYWRLKNEET
jgi:predicted transcriptional regulator